ncbi:MAG: hypothetical protein ACXW1D_07495, partial [Halobacteriota archaeon]
MELHLIVRCCRDDESPAKTLITFFSKCNWQRFRQGKNNVVTDEVAHSITIELYLYIHNAHSTVEY